jgi:LacI family gluconate utilization system Gnt-I transcriptional repressor
VETWESSDEPIDVAVGFSNRDAACAMTLHLAQRGYRRIAFVNGPSNMNERARHRAEGYHVALDLTGLAYLAIEVVTDDEAIRAETGTQALDVLMTRSPRPDVFTSDVYAAGAILTCGDRGIRVPEELGIAGFHDPEMGRVVRPRLTTVHVPALEIGRKAAEVILARLSGQPATDKCTELAFKIIERESTHAG